MQGEEIDGGRFGQVRRLRWAILGGEIDGGNFGLDIKSGRLK